MGLTPDAIDEIGGRSRPLVEIPLPLSDKVAIAVTAACFVDTVPMLIGARSTSTRTRRCSGPGRC
jgi:hypothetical protein